MNMNRRGVIALPIKLLLVSIVLTISLPMIVDVMESNQDAVEMEKMETEADRITRAITSVYYSMYGATKRVEIDVPEGCMMVLGGQGDDAYSIRMFSGDDVLSTRWMEKPIVPFRKEVSISGSATIEISMKEEMVSVRLL